jgi:uncharacterized protein (UPF0332 family)
MMNDRDKKLFISYKIGRAESTLTEISNLIKFGYLHTSINRIYYTCFYSVQALMATIDLYPKSHSGLLRMFSLHFVKEGKVPSKLSDLYISLFHERQLADYAESSLYDQVHVEKPFTGATDFVNHIKMLIQEK